MKEVWSSSLIIDYDFNLSLNETTKLEIIENMIFRMINWYSLQVKKHINLNPFGQNLPPSCYDYHKYMMLFVIFTINKPCKI